MAAISIIIAAIHKMRRKIINEEKLNRRLCELVESERLSGGAALLVELCREVGGREGRIEHECGQVLASLCSRRVVNAHRNSAMLLEGEIIEVTDTNVAVGCGLQGLVVRVERGVDVVGDNVGITGQCAVLDNKSGILSLLGSLQLCLGDCVDDEHHHGRIESLVGELSNSLQNVLVSLTVGNLDVSGRSKVRERTLHAGETSLRIYLLGEVATESELELALNESEDIEGSVVDSRVAHAHGERNTMCNGLDVVEVEVLVVHLYILAQLLEVNIVNRYRPKVVASHTSDECESAGQSESLVECADKIVDVESDCARLSD